MLPTRVYCTKPPRDNVKLASLIMVRSLAAPHCRPPCCRHLCNAMLATQALQRPPSKAPPQDWLLQGWRQHGLEAAEVLPDSPMNSLEGVVGWATRYTVDTVTSRSPGVRSGLLGLTQCRYSAGHAVQTPRGTTVPVLVSCSRSTLLQPNIFQPTHVTNQRTIGINMKVLDIVVGERAGRVVVSADRHAPCQWWGRGRWRSRGPRGSWRSLG